MPSRFFSEGLNPSRWQRGDSVWLLLLLGFAALPRAAFYTGFFGSDEMLYLRAAWSVAYGEWRPDDYVGALRYGINLPMALFLRLFGPGETTAAAWSFLCSLLEVATVYLLARALWGRRAALIAGLLIASLPIHVHMAGRLMADSPLAFFMTFSFLLFLFAERRASALLYLGAGLAGGFVFWIKEVAIIYLALFLPLALAGGGWKPRHGWFIAGIVLMLTANSLLMWQINGDPLHVFRMVQGRVNEAYLGGGEFRGEAAYYLHYLFLKIQHTGLLGPLALAGAAFWAWRGRQMEPETASVVIWAAGLLLLFSLFPISFSPLTLIAKQSNYLTLFAAPLCLLAGYFLARLRGPAMPVINALCVASGISLAALEQAAAHAASANARGGVLFAAENPGIAVYGPMLAEKAWAYQARLNLDWHTPIVRRYEGLSDANITHYPAYVVWAPRGKQSPPACWQPRGTVDPAPAGRGGNFAAGLRRWARALPEPIGRPLARHLDPLVEPPPAPLYEIPRDCAFNLDRHG